MLATWMQSPVPREKILTAKYLLEDFKYDELAASLQMLDPRRATVAVICRELPKNAGLTFDKKEPIYGTDYCEKRLSPEFMKEVSNLSITRLFLMCRLQPVLLPLVSTCLDLIYSFPRSWMWRSWMSRIQLYDLCC
jgi:secreted Zn-dependent insulinase-like peptidase